MNLLDLPRDEFTGYLAEMAQSGVPRDRINFLRREYRAKNSPFRGIFDFLQSQYDRVSAENRRPLFGDFLTVDPSKSGFDRLRSIRGDLGLFAGSIANEIAMGLDAPSAVLRGDVPAEDMLGEAFGTAGTAMIGGGLAPRPDGSVNAFPKITSQVPQNLRDRYSSALNFATDYKEDVQKIELTPETITKAKEYLVREYDPTLFGTAQEAVDFKEFINSPTKQMLDAQKFATAAKQAGEEVKFKMPDGPRGSLYVRVGNKGTVRFSDHSQPMEYDASGKLVPVGGFSPTLGRRHGAATLSVDPSSGLSVDDAISDLLSANRSLSLGAGILSLKAQDNPRLNQILMDFDIDPDNADTASLPMIDAALSKAVNQEVIDARDANALFSRFAEQDQMLDEFYSNKSGTGGVTALAASKATPAGETTPYSEVPVIDPRDLIGAKISPTPADLTRAGSFYEGIDAAGTARQTPFLGGPMFPLQQAYRDADVAWMVDSKSKGQTKLNKDSDFVAVTAMSPKAHQSNATVADAYMGTLEAYIKDGRLPEKSVKQLNKVVTEFGKNTVDPELKKLKNFVGFDSPNFDDYMRGLTFPQREAISKLMTAPKVRDIGGPNFQRILDSSIQPEFAGSNLGDTLLLLELNKKAGLLDVNKLGLPEHPSYSVGLPGQVVGRFENPISRGLLFPEFEAEYSNRPTIMRSDGTPDAAQMAYSFSRALPTTKVTPEGAKNMQEAMQYYNIEQPLQAQLIDQALQSNWKTSTKPFAQGKGDGISPVEYQRALERNPSYNTLEPYTAQEISKAARKGDFEVLQLGRSDIYFGLKKNPDYTWMNDGNPVPGLSDNEVDLVGVVSNEIGAKGVASPAIMGKAIEKGASVLNAFAVPSERYPEGFLPNVYGGYGFEEIKRIPFSKEFYIKERGEAAYRDLLRQWRSEGWDESRGFPDVVLMKWSGTDEQRANASQRVFDKGFEGFGSGKDFGSIKSAGQNLEPGVEASLRSQAVKSDIRPRDTGAVRSSSRPSKPQGIRSAVEELRSLSPLQRKNLGLLSFNY